MNSCIINICIMCDFRWDYQCCIWIDNVLVHVLIEFWKEINVQWHGRVDYVVAIWV